MATYVIKADAIYTDAEEIDLALALVKDGAVLTTATSATAALRSLDGSLLDSFTTVASPDAQGVFHFTAVERTLAAGAMYYVNVSVADGATTLSDVLFVKRL